MCGACFTQIDAVGLESVAFAVSAVATARRARLFRGGVSRAARRRRDWDESAAFLGQMGHDPAALLGPRPAEEATLAASPPLEDSPLGEPLLV